MNDFSRASLSVEVDSLKPGLETAFQVLQSQLGSNYYVSVVFESRRKIVPKVNLQGHQISHEKNEGLILRVFDGTTLFEQACDDLSDESLTTQSELLVNRVQSQSSGSRNPYQPPSWSQRLHDGLESEILSQVPDGVDSSTWVHFGTRLKKQLWETEESMIQEAKDHFNNLRAEQNELAKNDLAKNPQMLLSGLQLETLEFLFIDSSVRMSQTLCRNFSVVAATKNGVSGVYRKGGLGGRETTELDLPDFEKPFEDLRKTLSAKKLKPGRYKLLMHPAITGVFAHEAFGHTQEGDTWARGRSKARELYEKQVPVGNKLATIVNNPAVFDNGADQFGAWGSYFFDEEGWLAQKHFLVKDGYLQTPMTNFTSSVRLGVERTANGKREAWTNGVYARQTNTYFAEGDETLGQLMKKIDYGFLASTPYGGMEDPKGMGIQVGIKYLEEIKNGKLTGKIFRGPAGGEIQMTGYVPDYLNGILGCSKIDHLSDEVDLSSHPWNEVGGCGKYHKEFVAAGCGGPYLLVDQVLLG